MQGVADFQQVKTAKIKSVKPSMTKTAQVCSSQQKSAAHKRKLASETTSQTSKKILLLTPNEKNVKVSKLC